MNRVGGRPRLGWRDSSVHTPFRPWNDPGSSLLDLHRDRTPAGICRAYAMVHRVLEIPVLLKRSARYVLSTATTLLHPNCTQIFL